MGRPRKENKDGKKGKTILGIPLDNELEGRIEEYLKDKSITRTEFVKRLICKELGIEYVPGHYEELI